MTAWNDMVKKIAKGNPGKSLKEILPLAKVEYRKTHNLAVCDVYFDLENNN